MPCGMSDEPATVLVVDDDASVAASLTLLLKRAGFKDRIASNPEEALEAIDRHAIDIVLQDMNFARATTGEEGLRLLREIRQRDAVLPVVLMTAWGSIALAVEGMKAGANDFVTKPWDNATLVQVLKTALSLSAIRRRPIDREPVDRSYGFEDIVGEDPGLLRVLDFVTRVAKTDATVLITGESGSGKELLANAIHRNSSRAAGPLVKVNMGAVAPSLFESEMFGHVRGAFTDAREDRTGYFEQAQGGTILLDEVAELDLTSQVKLLRVLQDREFRRVGSSAVRKGDFRVIAATNRNLQQLVAQEQFREDFYYRLNSITLELPPLRGRRGDIALIADAHLQEIGKHYRLPDTEIEPEAYAWLTAQSWPGNIRQLRQTIERVVLLSGHRKLTRADFEEMGGAEETQIASPPHAQIRRTRLDELEKATIEEALARSAHNITRAAELLGLSRPALYRRLAKHGLLRG